MNLLFTSTGRRGYVIRYFRDALAGKGLVHAANSEPINSAFLEADRFVITPLIYDKTYIEFLLDYCRQHDIKAVIPLFDIDLPVLAQHADEFADIGANLIVSPLRVCAICNDKWKTYEFLMENGFHTPLTFISLQEAEGALNNGLFAFPVVLKPRWGMGSIGLYTADTLAELRLLYKKVERDIKRTYLKYEPQSGIGASVLIQEKLDGQEYGLDIVNDLDGSYVTTFVKRKIAMRAGETDAAVSVISDSLSNLGEKISGFLGHRANLDVDVFTLEDKAYVLEMNARFGGGYPFSHLAGANLPRAILSWIEGKPADPSCFAMREGVMGIKAIEPSVVSWRI
jgi:carbamoyl-phosphate synthase large subunit